MEWVPVFTFSVLLCLIWGMGWQQWQGVKMEYAVRTDDGRRGKGTMHLRGGRERNIAAPRMGVAVGSWGTLDTWRHKVGLRA